MVELEAGEALAELEVEEALAELEAGEATVDLEAGEAGIEGPAVESKARRGRKLLPPAVQSASRAWTRVMQGVGFSLAFGAAAAGSILLFRMLNRTKVHGLRNIPSEHLNVLYCLNHNSILDNFAFEVATYIPKVLFRPKYLPISLADRKNFFGDPDSRRFKDRVLRLLGRHFFQHLKAHPVDRKSSDLAQVDQWIELLKENIVIVFPEGTRTRTGEIGPGKPGVGKMIYDARPTVIPVHMTGTGEVLGVGRRIPDVFRTIEVFIGEPMDLSAWIDRPLPEDRKEQLAYYADISQVVLDAIRDLNPATRVPPPPAEPEA